MTPDEVIKRVAEAILVNVALQLPAARLYTQNGYRRAAVTRGPGEILLKKSDVQALVRSAADRVFLEIQKQSFEGQT